MMAIPPAATETAGSRSARTPGAAGLQGNQAGKPGALPFALPDMPVIAEEIEIGEPAADPSETSDSSLASEALALLAPMLPAATEQPSPATERALAPDPVAVPAEPDSPLPAEFTADVAFEPSAKPLKAQPAELPGKSAEARAAEPAAAATGSAPASMPHLQAGSSPRAGEPALAATPSSARESAGSNPDSAPGQQKQDRNTASPALATTESRESSVQLPPFRLEAQSVASPLASVRTPAPAVAAAHSLTPDLAEENNSAQVPDIVVETGAGRGLAVTISAHSQDGVRRIEQARHELTTALTELGTEVEAIRVELAADRGPDNGHGPASADRGERQGQQGTPQHGFNKDARDEQARELAVLARGQQTRLRLSVVDNEPGLATMRPRPDGGRIDLYA